MVLDKVINIIATVFQVGYSDIAADRDLMAYGMDSARAMDLVIALEDTFNVEIPDALIMQLRTINDIVVALESL